MNYKGGDMRTLFSVLILTVTLACSLYAVDAFGAPSSITFDFENDTQNWNIADWAGEQKDCVAKSLELSNEKVSKGANSLKIMCAFPGDKWTQVPLEFVRDMDLTGYKSISADIFLPKQARSSLFQARIILTVGPWWFVEMKAPVPLRHGEWTTVTAKLDVSDLDEAGLWRVKDKSQGLLANINRVRKITVRIEYNASTKNADAPYKGPVYVDHIVIE